MKRKKSIESEYWRILKKHLGKKYVDDFAHGLPHVKRVYCFFNSFKKNNKMVENDIIKALECAVILHDIGRSKENKLKKKHAQISAEILKELFEKKLKNIKHQDWIIYAVENHSKDLPGRLKNPEYKCYALLTFFDLMDTIGDSGIIRDLVYVKYKNLPFLPTNRGYLEKIIRYIDNPEKISKIIKENNESSILGHIAFNYLVMLKDVIPRVKTILDPVSKKEMKERLKFIKDFFLINQSRPH